MLTLKTTLGSLHLINTCQIVKVLERLLLKMFDSVMQKKITCSAMSSLIQWTHQHCNSNSITVLLPSHR